LVHSASLEPFSKRLRLRFVTPLFLNVFSKRQKMEPFDTKIASLTYLTNPLYQQVLKQQTQNTMHNSKSDIKFYRKRITALTKDMLKGEIPDNSYIKTIYETYVNGLIKYFKMVDTSDIIQQQYVNADDTTAGDTTAGDTTAGDTTAGDTTAGDTTAGDTTAGDTTAGDTTAGIAHNHNEIPIDNTLMRKYAGVSTLDNFVIKQPNETKETRIIPLIIDVDLKEPSLKKKGVKEKVKKSAKGAKGAEEATKGAEGAEGAKGAEQSEKLVIKRKIILNENI
jgi:hypothetical protein